MNQYNDGTGKWHTQYAALLKTKSVECLKNVIQDCHKAILARPENLNIPEYTDEINYCHAELIRREN